METINKKDTDKDKEIDKDLKKKIYYVSKVSNIDNYTHEIQGLFDNPQNYLQKKSEIIIGNANKGPRFDSKDNVIPHSIIGSNSIFDKLIKRRGTKSHTFLKEIHYNKSTNKIKDQFSLGSIKGKLPNFKLIKDHEIDEIYTERIENMKKTIHSTRSNDHGYKQKEKGMEFRIDIPKTISSKLISQENCLINSERKIENDNILSRNIGFRIHRSQEDLIMSRTNEYFRSKVENSHINQYRPGYNLNSWIADLRKNKKNKGPRFVYINAGTEINPKWILRKDNKEIKLEYIRKPYENFDTSDGKTSSFLRNKAEKEERIKSLKIQGTNLIEEEYSQLKWLSGKNKILFLDNNENSRINEIKHYFEPKK